MARLPDNIYITHTKKLVTRRHAIATIALFILAMASLWPVQSARDNKALTEGLPTQVER